ncbi:MAG: 5-(carboxyamino)imidazole ribonucleotide mutase [Candidatus Omnitrophica bacterium]|nr:5-(carboxyamino)imidazole ribonucleotide mutase [Candidatus Omnitrophota bacterium]
MSQVTVAIMMGSKSDADIMREAANMLEEFGVSCEMRVLSAHRTPRECAEYAENFRKNGGKVFICGAGVSAALSGVVAAHTTLPVIGVPIDASPLGGMDALLSTVQMPPGVPVGAVAIGKSGAKNAALLAVRILSLSDESLVGKLEQFRDNNKKKILDTKL